ncbi:MAG: hypothetical protein JXA25_16635 [Anaerolineales bacterium]|nr:hypothetical protein [Anaerolineales bacterium]
MGKRSEMRSQNGRRRWVRFWISWLLVSFFLRAADAASILLHAKFPVRIALAAGIGLTMGLLQWLVIRKEIRKGAEQWIVATWLTYLAAAAVSFSLMEPLEQALRLRPGFTEYDRIAVLFYLLWFFEALFTGAGQSLLMNRWSETGRGWVFILLGTTALEFLIVSSTGALALLLIHESLTGLLILFLSMCLSFSLSGLGLIRFLKPIPGAESAVNHVSNGKAG